MQEKCKIRIFLSNDKMYTLEISKDMKMEYEDYGFDVPFRVNNVLINPKYIVYMIFE